MREHLRRALFAFCAWLAVDCGLLPAAAAAADAVRPYRITMILYRGCEDACRHFQLYFRKHGIPAQFTLRDAAQDKDTVRRFVAEARAARPDLIVAWGTSVALETVGPHDAVDPARHITDIPVLFMVVSQPVSAGIVKSLAAPGRNVSGVLYLLAPETQIRAARAYLDFKRVGFIVNGAEENSLITRDQIRALSGRFGFALIERELPRDAAGKPDAASLPRLVAELAAQKVDLIYQPPDTFLNVNRDVLTSAALSHRIPVFAAAEAPVVNSSALFGVAIRYQDVGRYTAHLAERILVGGERPQNIAIELPRHFSYLVNMRVAAELERYPPLKLLDVAELTGTPASAPQISSPDQLQPK
jgi:putative ABC transport system substrate-binding protein